MASFVSQSNHALKECRNLSRSILLQRSLRRLHLSGFAKVVGWSERRSVGGMEVNFESGEESLGGLLESREVVPLAVTGELALR